jgi:hypothetical protein
VARFCPTSIKIFSLVVAVMAVPMPALAICRANNFGTVTCDLSDYLNQIRPPDRSGSNISSRANPLGGFDYSNGVSSRRNPFGGYDYSNGITCRPNPLGGMDCHR